MQGLERGGHVRRAPADPPGIRPAAHLEDLGGVRGAASGPEGGEQRLAGDTRPAGVGAHRRSLQVRGGPNARPYVVQDLKQPMTRDLGPEELRSGLRHGVGRQVPEVERMVHDEQLRLLGGGACTRHMTLRHKRTLRAEAGLGGGREALPQRVLLRQARDLGAVAGLGPRRPVQNPLELGVDDVGRCAPARGDTHVLEPPEAQVVLTALQHRRLDGATESALQARHVLPHDLVLQVPSRRGHDHGSTGDTRRREVRQRFACARPGLGEQDPAVLEDRGDSTGEVELTRAGLEARCHPRHQAAGAEHTVDAPGHGGAR